MSALGTVLLNMGTHVNIKFIKWCIVEESFWNLIFGVSYFINYLKGLFRINGIISQRLECAKPILKPKDES